MQGKHPTEDYTQPICKISTKSTTSKDEEKKFPLHRK